MTTNSSKQTASLGTGTTIRFTYYTPSSTGPMTTPTLGTTTAAPASGVSSTGSAPTASASPNSANRHRDKLFNFWTLALWFVGLVVVILPATVA